MEPERALRAISHPTRRTILTLVTDGERTSSEIADAVGLSKPATSQHLTVLRDAGLVERRVDGPQRWYRARPSGLAELKQFLDEFWATRCRSIPPPV